VRSKCSVPFPRLPQRPADSHILGGGRLFRSVNGAPVQPSTWWRIWKATRALWLTPAQAATPLLSRPYDLRHSGVTWQFQFRRPAD
jgi:integrase